MPDDKANAGPGGDDKPLTVAERARAHMNQDAEDALPSDVDGGSAPPPGDGSSTGAAGADGDDSLTPEAWAGVKAVRDRLLDDPAFFREALGRHTDVVDELADEVLSEVRQADESKRTQAAAQATLGEALRKAEEESDYSDIGRLAFESLQRQRARAELEPAVMAQAEDQLYEELDTILEASFPDEVATLSEADINDLNKRFQEGGFQAVLGEFQRRRDARLEKEWGTKLSAAEEANRNMVTASKVSGDGQMLPGGVSDKDRPSAQTASVGSLIREGLAKALADEEG